MQKERSTQYFGEELDGLHYSNLTKTDKDASFPVTEENIAERWRIGLESTLYHTSAIAQPDEAYIRGKETFVSTERRKPLFNNCDHFIDQHITVPYSYVAATYYGSPYSKWYYFYRNALPYMAYYDLSPTIGSVFNASARAWWEMQPRFEGELSLLNFIFELKDFRDIAKVLLSNQRMMRFLRNFGKRFRRFPSPSKAGATIWLTKQFVVDPLVSDLGSIISQLQSSVLDAQKQFGLLGRDEQKRHYTEVLNQDLLYTLGTVSTGIPRQTLVTRSDVFTATLRYAYDFVPYDAYQAFLRYWGLRLTPEAIWNALPFSFMADYFAQIGKSLHRMEVDEHVDIHVHQYCESVLSTIFAGVHLVGNSLTRGYGQRHKGHPGPIQFPVFLSGRRISRYTRRVKSPNKSLALIKVKKPGYKQKLNMLALARCFIG